MSPFAIAQAYAQQATPAGPAAPGGVAALIGNPLTMLVVIFAIFYFLIIRPQNKKQREHQEMLKKLVKGDKVVTTGGIYGTVIAETENILTLQVDDKVKIRVARSAITGKTNE